MNDFMDLLYRPERDGPLSYSDLIDRGEKYEIMKLPMFGEQRNDRLMKLLELLSKQQGIQPPKANPQMLYSPNISASGLLGGSFS
jgi:hypothetical protein